MRFNLNTFFTVKVPNVKLEQTAGKARKKEIKYHQNIPEYPVNKEQTPITGKLLCNHNLHLTL